jgi:hypothetical protein
MDALRRLTFALLLALGVAPAFGQAPPAIPALPDQERRTAYSLTANTCVCAINFAIYGDSTDVDEWIQVWVAGVRYLSTDPTYGWSLSSPTGPLATIPRPITDAVLTFNNAQTATVQIVGARRPRQLSQFQENRGVAARDLNQRLTDITAIERELWDKTNDLTGRGFFFAPGNTTGPMPSPAQCAGAILGFDPTGLNPTCIAAVSLGALVVPNTTTVGDTVCFNSTTGKAFSDCGPGPGLFGTGGNQFQFLPRSTITTHPVAGIRPTQANTISTLDILPNGSPAAAGEGNITWTDACDADLIANPSAPVTCARFGDNTVGNYVGFGSVAYSGASLRPICILYGLGNCVGTFNGTSWSFTGLNFASLAPTPTRAGDVLYWNGSAWVTLAGNNSGTQVLQETSSGVPTWATVTGIGTVTSAAVAASGGATTSGTCTITSSGTCTVAVPGGFLNVLRNNSLTSWFHGCVASACTITTSGGWCAEGVFVIPTGASVTCQRVGIVNYAIPYYAMKITGASGVTDVKLRFVVESLQANLLASQNVTFQMQWTNLTGATVVPTEATKYAGSQDSWGSPTTDLPATNMQSCSASAICTEAYTNTVGSSGIANGYEFIVDLGNNFGAGAATATINAFDARVSPGVSTGLNSNPPPMEVRDPESDIRWNERFYASSCGNGNVPGTCASHLGMVAPSLYGGTTAGALEPPVFFPVPLRCTPASIPFWDGAGTANKFSYTASASTTFVDNTANSGAGIFNISPVSFLGSFYSGSVAVTPFIHYTADCTIPGG